MFIMRHIVFMSRAEQKEGIDTCKVQTESVAENIAPIAGKKFEGLENKKIFNELKKKKKSF